MMEKPIQLTEDQVASLVKDMDESSKAFVQKLATDEAFRNKFQNVKSPEEALKITSDDGGIVLTMVQLQNVLTSLTNATDVVGPSGELSDTALEKVAGGSDSDWAYAGTAA